MEKSDKEIESLLASMNSLEEKLSQLEKRVEDSKKTIKEAEEKKKRASELGVKVPTSVTNTSLKKSEETVAKAEIERTKMFSALKKIDRSKITKRMGEEGYVKELVNLFEGIDKKVEKQESAVKKAVVNVKKMNDSMKKEIKKAESDPWADVTYFINSEQDFDSQKLKQRMRISSIICVVVKNNNIKSIPTRFFRGLSTLSIVDLNNVETIGDNAFERCENLVSLDLKNVKEIGNEAFCGCKKLEEVVNIGRVKTIGCNAFDGCSELKSFSAPLIEDVGGGTFRDCSKLENFSAPNITLIGDYAFSGCSSLKKFIAQNVVTIGDNAFEGCTLLESLNTNPEKLDSVGFEAFSDCKALETISVRNATLGGGVFKNCESLKKIDIRGYQYTFVKRENVLEGCSALKEIKVSYPYNSSSKELLEETEDIKKFVKKITGKEAVVITVWEDEEQSADRINVKSNQVKVILVR